MESVQMNTRIELGLKSSGDLAIRESGHTPSEIVRAVWGYAARNQHKPKAIAALLDFLADAKPQSETGESATRTDSITAQVMAGPRLIEGFCRERGIDPSRLGPTNYENLKAAAFDDTIGAWS